MRLRTFESFWLIKNGLLYSYPSLSENIKTEIAVVGAGITGALISHALTQAGYKVVLLDKRDVAMGSTSATTSMLQYEIDVPLFRLSEKIGEKAAAACYKAGISAIKDLARLIKDHKIDCGFKSKESLYLAHNVSSEKRLRKEYEIRNKHRLGVKWLTKEQVYKTYGIKCEGAILSSVAASIDAYRFTHELIQVNLKKGLKVYDQTAIKKITYRKNKSIIHVENGYEVSCNKVVYCSGFETTALFKEKIADLISTFACVSEQNIKVKKKLHDTLVWNTADPYLYMRTTDDGRLLAGGEDVKYNSAVMREKLKAQKSKQLIRKVNHALPHVEFTEDFNWGGVFGTTKDGLPYIGSHPDFKNAFFVLGFGGNGITFSVQGMKLILKSLRNENDELLNYYRFGR